MNKLSLLVQAWPDKADRPSTNTLSDGVVVGLRACADDLEAALAQQAQPRFTKEEREALGLAGMTLIGTGQPECARTIQTMLRDSQ